MQHSYEFEKQLELHYWIKQGNKVKCNCGNEVDYIKGMIGRTLDCNKCNQRSVVLTTRKTIKANGIYYNEDIKDLCQAFYTVKNFEVLHKEVIQVTRNYGKDNVTHLKTLVNNQGRLSFHATYVEEWRKPIPSIKKESAYYAVSTNVKLVYRREFEVWYNTRNEWKKRNKYLTEEHLKILEHYIPEKSNCYYSNTDPFVIEKLINQYPKYLHWYMDDNFNLLDLKKDERKFIIENGLHLHEAEVLLKTHRQDLKFIRKWLSSLQYQEHFNKAYKELKTANKHFVITMPKTPEELTEEGRKLHHCVGSYKNKHGKTTTIVFVRKAKEPLKPYITCEFKRGKISQFYTEHNEQPTGIALYKEQLEKELQEQLC